MANEPTIEIMNEAIALFMGMRLEESYPSGYIEHEWVPSFAHSNWCFKEPPPFDRSWGWLMPVVEKIIAYRFSDAVSCQDTAWPRTFGMPSEAGGFMVRFNRNPVFTAGTLLEATYQAVYYFIKCSNQQKQNNEK